MNAPTLFDPVPVARASDPITSHHAADVARRNAPEQRRRLLVAFAKAGRWGLNADEADRECGWDKGTAGRRLKELADAGQIRDSGMIRRTARGGKGVVYVLARAAA